MDCSTPGFPVYHQLPEVVQTHVHLVSDAIQPSHPLSSPPPPAFSLSQHRDRSYLILLYSVFFFLIYQLSPTQTLASRVQGR